MLYKINFGENNNIKLSDVEMTDLTFKEMKINEADIEEFIRKNVEIIFDENAEETLLIVGQQVVNKEKGRSDLVAIDSNGNIVLIEIKRDIRDITSRKEAFELQAIRYAANFARIKTPEELVDKIYSNYIQKYKSEYKQTELTSDELGRRLLTKFLEENNSLKTFNKKQKIMLIASSFDPQTLSAVSWLISNNVDISCISITPKKIGNDIFIDTDKILPPNKIEDFYIDVIDKFDLTSKKISTTIKKTYLPRMPKLLEWELIKIDDIVYIKNYENDEAVIISSNEVKYKDEVITFNTWGQKITGWSSINIYEWAIHQKSGKTLDELRKEKIDKDNED